jgi:hypothetical protein
MGKSLIYGLEIFVRVKRRVNGLVIDDLGCSVGRQKNSVRWIIYADPEAFEDTSCDRRRLLFSGNDVMGLIIRWTRNA